MRHLDYQGTADDFSDSWCNSDTVTTSLMEAISFVTPVLENFFIEMVAADLRKKSESELDLRCRDFMREESIHSRAHKKFNASLLCYLKRPPPGLALVQWLLDAAKKHMSVSSRLLLVAALEHFAAVFSNWYLHRAERWEFQSPFARELFARHAREEMAHRSVVFDLWLHKGSTGRFKRLIAVSLIVFTGLVYVFTAMPWIVHRKTGKHMDRAFAALAGFAMRNCSKIKNRLPFFELFWFIRRDFHPDRLFQQPGTVKAM